MTTRIENQKYPYIGLHTRCIMGYVQIVYTKSRDGGMLNLNLRLLKQVHNKYLYNIYHSIVVCKILFTELNRLYNNEVRIVCYTAKPLFHQSLTSQMPLGLCQKKKQENNHRCLVTGARGSTSLWVWEKAEAFHRIYGKLELILGWK